MELIGKFVQYFWQKLLEWFWWILDSLYSPFRWIGDAILLIAKFCIFTTFDGFLTAVEVFFNGIDSSSLAFLNLFSRQVHPVIIWFIQQLGVVQGFEIIATALGIRLLLNLIPAAFTRI